MYKRNCPSCNKDMEYKNKRKHYLAEQNNGICQSCSKKGENNPMFGIIGLNNPRYGKEQENIKGDNNPAKRSEVRVLISERNKGKVSPMKGKHHTNKSISEISKSNLGQKRDQETIEKIKIARSKQIGEKCPGWKGGITLTIKNIRNCDYYKKWRILVIERDNHTCQKCKLNGMRLEVHHIIAVYERLDLICDLSNGITLCKECHNKFHKEYGLKSFPDIKKVWNL